MKEKDPTLQNVELAQKYNVGKSTITNILRESDRWLTITESKENTKKFRRPKWPQLEGALGLWVDNALNTKQDIDGNILKKKTGILPPSINKTGEFPDNDSAFSDDSFDMDIDELEALISQLPNNDLNTYEYLHVEDEMPKGGLTDFEIVDTIRNADKEEEDMMDETEFTPISEKVSPTDAEKAMNKTIKFLYEQRPEFGDVNEELKVLRKLHKKVKLLVVNNLKQLDLHYFQYNNNV
ncbi:uncharacterized protein OCT59_026272 [Rhizophagus irregularis]|uniref:uncharacterized protein n=1 Tax=Rhizophagus irregularis TaxID=588596 RepID=UPI0033242A02|nr:hypothetical protein OCT59_026272 [Rhizophagus irregularis]